MRYLILSVIALAAVTGTATASPAVSHSTVVLTAPEVQHVQYYDSERHERGEMRRRREIERRREHARRRAERREHYRDGPRY